MTKTCENCGEIEEHCFCKKFKEKTNFPSAPITHYMKPKKPKEFLSGVHHKKPTEFNLSKLIVQDGSIFYFRIKDIKTFIQKLKEKKKRYQYTDEFDKLIDIIYIDFDEIDKLAGASFK